MREIKLNRSTNVSPISRYQTLICRFKIKLKIPTEKIFQYFIRNVSSNSSNNVRIYFIKDM